MKGEGTDVLLALSFLSCLLELLLFQIKPAHPWTKPSCRGRGIGTSSMTRLWFLSGEVGVNL